jgi:murein DD-endopeptidase MepM/ murein hydrolase activator NlpD
VLSRALPALALALVLALSLPAPLRADGLAELEVVHENGDVLAFAINRTAGPLQVELSAVELVEMASDVPLPASRVLSAGERARMARLQPLSAASRHALSLDATPGEPGRVARDVVYSLPVQEGNVEVGQGFHGNFSHQDRANRYAVDLIVPTGTPVLAARPGTVIGVAAGFREGGQDAALSRRANFIRILHDDGSMALYAHLQEDGVEVVPGEQVGLGQRIGLTGNTGYTSGPHLHFAVQLNAGMRLVSIPFRMVGPDGYLDMGSP